MPWRGWLPNWLSGLSEGDEPVEPLQLLRHFTQSLEKNSSSHRLRSDRIPDRCSQLSITSAIFSRSIHRNGTPLMKSSGC